MSSPGWLAPSGSKITGLKLIVDVLICTALVNDVAVIASMVGRREAFIIFLNDFIVDSTVLCLYKAFALGGRILNPDCHRLSIISAATAGSRLSSFSWFSWG